MLERIKQRCGIAYGVAAYDIEIEDYISECIQDLISSGVPENIAKSDNPAVITAIVAEACRVHRTDFQAVGRATPLLQEEHQKTLTKGDFG